MARRLPTIGVGAAAALALAASAFSPAAAETLGQALARAYVGNPDLEQQRADVRARDEDVPRAAAGMMPKASLSGHGGGEFSRVRQPAGRSASGKRAFSTDHMLGQPHGASFSLSQPLFDGGRTANSVRQAEFAVFASREAMRLAEQETLQNGAAIYMNVLRDTAVCGLRKNNVLVLEEQLRQTRDRSRMGDATITDVALAEAALARSRSDFYEAQSRLSDSVAAYRQIFGVEPTRLEPPPSIEALLPRSTEEAIDVALVEHPGVASALHQEAAASAAVDVAEGALLPTVSVDVGVVQQYDSFLGYPGSRQFSAQALGSINVPLYQGGAEYASIRRAKEIVGKARLAVDSHRATTRAAVVASFGQLRTAKVRIVADQAAVKAAETALKGVRDEVQLGQRTMLDLLYAQQALLDARVRLVASQRDRIVASYAALGSVGRLSAATLGLDAPVYDPKVHFERVRDKKFGVEIEEPR
jgi:outer membrane protein